MKTSKILSNWRALIIEFLTKNGFDFINGSNSAQVIDSFWNEEKRLVFHFYDMLGKTDKDFLKGCLEQIMTAQIGIQKHFNQSIIELFNEPIIWATMHDLDTSDITKSVASIYAVISRKEKVDVPFLNYTLCGFYEECAKDGGWITNPNFGAQFFITQFIAK